MPLPPPPPPLHLLRTHQHPISSLHFNTDNTLLFAGDQEGWVSITSLKARRVVCFWKAHEAGVLGLEQWEGSLISQGRDNRILIHEPFTLPPGPTLSGPSPNTPPPSILHTLETNSLNFCRFSLASLPGSGSDAGGGRRGKGKAREVEAVIAVPNIDDSELADIYHLPTLRPLHTRVNFVLRSTPPPSTHLPTSRSGLIMSLHLHVHRGRPIATTTVTGLAKEYPGDTVETSSAVSERGPVMRLVAGFEDGRVEVWACDVIDSGEGQAGSSWDLQWQGKEHNEAVMAMVVDPGFTNAFTVSADHLLCRYDLTAIRGSATCSKGAVDARSIVSAWSTGQMGNASLAISADGLVVAVGGWDGQIRLFSAASGKALGVLTYHRDTVHTIAFASNGGSRTGGDGMDSGRDKDGEDEDEDDEEDEEEEEEGIDDAPPRERWMASGGKDTRLAIWALRDFTKS